MININQTGKVFAIAVIALLLGVVLFSGCTDEKKVVETQIVVEKDTIFVSIVSVDAINASLDSVTQGLPITLTVQITKGAQAGTVSVSWSATGGHFDKTTGDTVTWTSPDDPGVYMIKVVADDGTYSGVGTRMIGVGMYVPTATPYYLGDVACSQCHSDNHGDWALTAHAHAWESLQNSGHPASYCNPCHAVGFEPSPNTGNSGYDEAPIEKFVNVQCENCHLAASDHIAGGTPDPTKIEVSFDVMVCGKCHDGEHHPYLTEWESSPHNFDNPRIGSCMGCHEGVAASIRLSGEAAAYPLGAGNFYGGGSFTERPDTSEVPMQPVVCQTCHDPHNVDNPGQLRTVADVQLVTANGESPVITEGGVGKLCMQCHHARRGPESQIQNGYAHFGPHANPQADMLKAKSAYHAVADSNFVWAGPSHLLVQNSCKTCHLSTVEFGGGPGGAAVSGHEFIPKPEACVGCHGPITSFTDIPALEDFDGDGTVEGVQDEVVGLIHLLEDALIADGLDTTGVGFEGALGDTSISTFEQREAGYNLVFVEDDKSKGVHNPDYVVQLLQQSIQHLTGGPVPNAYIVRFDNEVVGNW